MTCRDGSACGESATSRSVAHVTYTPVVKLYLHVHAVNLLYMYTNQVRDDVCRVHYLCLNVHVHVIHSLLRDPAPHLLALPSLPQS